MPPHDGREAEHADDTGVPEPEADQHARIAARAFQRFLARGGEHGSALADWLEAEQAIRQEATATSASAVPAIDVERHAALIATPAPTSGPEPGPRAVGDDRRSTSERRRSR